MVGSLGGAVWGCGSSIGRWCVVVDDETCRCSGGLGSDGVVYCVDRYVIEGLVPHRGSCCECDALARPGLTCVHAGVRDDVGRHCCSVGAIETVG
jgi:hypothetical protein